MAMAGSELPRRRAPTERGAADIRGRSPDSQVIAAPAAFPSAWTVALAPAARCSQWRDRAGISPASLFTRRSGKHPGKGNSRDITRPGGRSNRDGAPPPHRPFEIRSAADLPSPIARRFRRPVAAILDSLHQHQQRPPVIERIAPRWPVVAAAENGVVVLVNMPLLAPLLQKQIS